MIQIGGNLRLPLLVMGVGVLIRTRSKERFRACRNGSLKEVGQVVLVDET